MEPKKLLSFFFFLILCLSSLSFVPSSCSAPVPILRVQAPTMPIIVKSNRTSYNLMVKGSYLTYFKNDSDASRAVNFFNMGYNFSMDISTSQLHWYNSTLNAIIGMTKEMNPQHTAVNVSGSSLFYSGAWLYTDLQYVASVDCLKETLVIHNVSVPSSSIKPDYLQYAANCYFNNSLAIYANSAKYLHSTNQQFRTSGEIDFNDQSNKTMFFLPKPYVVDAVGNQTVAAYAVTVNNGILIINIRISKAFIDHCVFPVYFDPVVRVHGADRGEQDNLDSNVPCTLANTPTSGNLLIAVISTGRSSGTVPTVTSINENNVVWFKAIGKSNSTIAPRDCEIWYGGVGTSASTSITVNLSTTCTNGAVDVCEYSGLASSNMLDVTASYAGLSINPVTGTTSTTNQASELWIGGIGAHVVGGAHLPGQKTPINSFTLLDGVGYQGYTTFGSNGYLEYIASSTGTASTGDHFNANVAFQYCGCIATFKALAGAAYSQICTTTEQLDSNVYRQTMKLFATSEAIPASLFRRIAKLLITTEFLPSDTYRGTGKVFSTSELLNSQVYRGSVKVLSASLLISASVYRGVGLIVSSSEAFDSSVVFECVKMFSSSVDYSSSIVKGVAKILASSEVFNSNLYRGIMEVFVSSELFPSSFSNSVGKLLVILSSQDFSSSIVKGIQFVFLPSEDLSAVVVTVIPRAVSSLDKIVTLGLLSFLFLFIVFCVFIRRRRRQKEDRIQQGTLR